MAFKAALSSNTATANPRSAVVCGTEVFIFTMYSVMVMMMIMMMVMMILIIKLHDPVSAKQMTNGIWHSLWLDLVNINVYAKCYQNMTHGSGVRASFILIFNFDQ